MKAIFKHIGFSAVIVLGLIAGAVALNQSASATSATYVVASAADEVQRGINAAGGADERGGFGNLIENIVNILLFIIGIAAVIMIVIGGLRYVLSGGDANATKGAKDTILYAIVGLIIAFLAYALVNFVTGQFS